MGGIEPPFEAYESPVLPLNYTGLCKTLAQNKNVGGTGLAPMSGGYEPPEILLLHPPHACLLTKTYSNICQIVTQ